MTLDLKSEDPTPSRAAPSLKAVLKGEAMDDLIFTGSNLINKFGGLILIPFYMQMLSPADFGVIAIISVFQSVLSTLGMELGVMRFYYEWSESERKRNLGAVWAWSWMLCAATSGLALLVMPYLTPILFPSVAYHPWILIGILSNAAATLFTLPITILRIKRMPLLFAGYNFMNFLLFSGITAFLVLYLEKGLTGYLVGNFLAGIVMTLLAIPFMAAIARPCLFSPGLRQVASVALPAVPASILTSVGSMLDRWLLNYFGGIQVLGILAVSTKFTDGLFNLHNSLVTVHGPVNSIDI